MLIKKLSTHIFAKEILAWSILKQNTLAVLMRHHLEVTLRLLLFFSITPSGGCAARKTVPLKSVYRVVTGQHAVTLSHGFLHHTSIC